jgi:hypothetical protein
VTHTAVFLEGAKVGEGHAAAQLGEPLVGHLAIPRELRVAPEDRLGEQPAARDLDAERALQAEDDVQKVDRLGPQVALQGDGRSDFVFVHMEGRDERRGHPPVDLFLCEHRGHPPR